MNNYRVAVFDFDGTLCSSESITFNAIKKTFEHFKLQPPTDEAIEIVLANGASMTDSLKMLSPSLMNADNTTIEAWLDNLHAIVENEKIPMYAGSSKVIKSLHESGIEIIIVSNNTAENITRILKQNKLMKFVNTIFGCTNSTASKPNPNIFLQNIYPEYNYPISKFIMIGDTSTDIQFSQNAGINCCWAQYGYGNPENCLALSPTYTIANILEVVPIIIGSKSHLSR
jgi:phosphoglycolate phosphatase